MAKTPKNDVNACEDVLQIITAGLVVAAVLATFHQASTNDHPDESVIQGADLIPYSTCSPARISL